MDALPSSDSLACPLRTTTDMYTQKEGAWGWLWHSGEAATSCGGGISNDLEQRLRLASCGRLPSQESRSQSKVKTRPPPDPISLIILWWSPRSKKCYKTEATVSWEKHINSHRGSLRVTVKMGTKAGCWPKLSQAFNPPKLEVSERIKLWLLKFVFFGGHTPKWFYLHLNFYF